MSQPFFLYLSFITYVIAGITAIFVGRRDNKRLSWLSIVFSLFGIINQVLFIIIRSLSNGFLPFASRFESMVLFALSVQFAGLILYLLTKLNWVKAGTDSSSIILLGVTLFVVGFTPGKNLNPILNSPFFAFHILISFAGYGVIITGLFWSIVSLLNPQMGKDTYILTRIAIASLLLLGTGILIGSIWADNSWGTYWSWDPKESWALLTWGILMVYVHVSKRTNRHWLSFLFFGLSTAVMLFSFIGINLLRLGLHRY
jgi:ABC-type transport system involved in cytochrome c biogenesis permease subunit